MNHVASLFTHIVHMFLIKCARPGTVEIIASYCLKKQLLVIMLLVNNYHWIAQPEEECTIIGLLVGD